MIFYFYYYRLIDIIIDLIVLIKYLNLLQSYEQ